METWQLFILFFIIVAIILLWTRFKLSAQEKLPMDRPESDFIEPPRREIAIGIERENGVPVRVTIEPSNAILTPQDQAAWRSHEGKIEIRFSPNESPFAGTSFIAARNGTTLSGPPRIDAPLNVSHNYLVLLTTTDGFLLGQDASVIVLHEK